MSWLYVDNGYFRSGHFLGYYSATWNAFQHTGFGVYERGKERYDSLVMCHQLKPWKKAGDYILVLPPTEVFSSLQGFTPVEWLADTEKKLKKYTDRPMRVRAKPGSILGGVQVPEGPSLEVDLARAYAVVSYNSKATIQAIIEGVPVFTPTPCCTYSMAHDSLYNIEEPYYPDDRERWLHALAANQFTLEEMRSGYCTRVLMEDIQSGHRIRPHPAGELQIYFK